MMDLWTEEDLWMTMDLWAEEYEWVMMDLWAEGDEWVTLDPWAEEDGWEWAEVEWMKEWKMRTLMDQWEEATLDQEEGEGCCLWEEEWEWMSLKMKTWRTKMRKKE